MNADYLSKYEFSELGYIVLGQVVAKIENTTLDKALFDVLVQAGMRDTHFKPNVSAYEIAPSGYNKGISRG